MADGHYLSPPSPSPGAVPMSVPPAPSPSVSEPIQSCAGRQEDPIDDITKIKIRVSLFFDGTGNNRKNIELRAAENRKGGGDAQAGTAQTSTPWWLMPGTAAVAVAGAVAGWVERKVDSSFYASWDAGFSNIAKLERANLNGKGPGVHEHFPLYVEGIGTDDGARDAPLDQALGTGSAGIRAKVEKGLAKAVEEVTSRAATRQIIEVHLDTFGFSRGAAAARLCVWCAAEEPGKSMQEQLQKVNKEPVGPLRVKFIGLYDTVASHGVRHKNDSDDLHLRAVAKAENRVVQLAAADEHRVNFRLTDIASAGGKATEIFLPGAHSDVGGGYAEIENETDYLLHEVNPQLLQVAPDLVREELEREKRWFIEQGWYKDKGELEIMVYRLVGNRLGIPNTYANIPLYIMMNFAREYGVPIDQSYVRDQNPLPAAKCAQQAQREIEAYVAKHRGGRSSSANDWLRLPPPAWLHDLRHDFLHFSASHNYVNTPQWSKDGKFRKRIIQAG